MINHISRQSPEFQDFQRLGRESPFADLFITLDKIWPRRRTTSRGRRADLPPQARRPVLDRDDRATPGAGADLDVVRNRGLVRADRPRRPVAGDPRRSSPRGFGRSPVTASALSGSTPSDTSSRSRGRPASWSSRRSRTSSTGSPRSPDPSASSSCPRFTTSTRPTTALGPRLLDIRLRPPGPAPAYLRDRRRRTACRPPRWIAGPAVHDARLSRWDPGPPRSRRDPVAGRDGRPGRRASRPAAETSTASCPTTSRRRATFTS